MSGFSKADRDIITRGNKFENGVKLRRLFGTGNTGIMSGGPTAFGSEAELSSPTRGRSRSLRPLKRDSKGKGPEDYSIPEEPNT